MVKTREKTLKMSTFPLVLHPKNTRQDDRTSGLVKFHTNAKEMYKQTFLLLRL